MWLRVESSRPLRDDYRWCWGWHVTGFDPAFHCQKCLLGSREPGVNLSMQVNRDLVFPALGDYFYLCLGDANSRYRYNVHLAVRPEPGAASEAPLAHGRLYLSGGRALPIVCPPLGFKGYAREFTTCRNWAFGLQQYGLAMPSQPRPLSLPSGLPATAG